MARCGKIAALNYYLFLIRVALHDMTPNLKKTKKTKPKSGRRRGPAGYFNGDMCAHLANEIPGFREAQAAGKLKEWWVGMHSRFGVVFPQAPLTAEEIGAGVKMEDRIQAEFKVSNQPKCTLAEHSPLEHRN